MILGSRFLNGSDTNLSELQNGTFELNVASVQIPTLNNNLPCVINDGYISERLLSPNDMNFTVASNPYRSTLSVIDLETLTTFSLNGEIQKIDNFDESGDGLTNINGTLNVDIIKTAEIYDPSDNSSLQFSNSSIGVLAANFNLNNNNITEVNDISANKFMVRGEIKTPEI